MSSDQTLLREATKVEVEPFEPIYVAADLELMQVGCPLLQAALGGSTRVLDLVPVESWLTYPTPKLQLYVVAAEWQLNFLVDRLMDRHRRNMASRLKMTQPSTNSAV